MGRSCSGSIRPRRGTCNINPIYLETIRQGLHDAAQSPGGTSDDVMGNFPQQVYGKTGTAQYNGQQDYSWYVCFVPSTATSKPIEVVGGVEQGGFGAAAAAPVARQILSQWFYGNRGPFQVGVLEDAMSTVPAMTPIRTGEAQAEARPRSPFLFDPLLLLAALGLIACSLITLKGATRNTTPGSPLYYVERQGIYAAIGLLLAALLSRIDYSRLREYKLFLYGLMIALDVVVFATPAIRGSHRWIPLPFLQFQSSEFGKILLVVSLAAFAVDRVRRLHERRTTARIMLLALIPALIVIPQPDLGTGLVYVTIGFTMLFVAGTSWKQLTALVAMFVASIAIVLAGGTGARGARAEAVPGAAPDRVPEPVEVDPQNQTYNIP